MTVQGYNRYASRLFLVFLLFNELAQVGVARRHVRYRHASNASTRPITSEDPLNATEYIYRILKGDGPSALGARWKRQPDKSSSIRLHLVVSYCCGDISWINGVENRHILTSISIVSKCSCAVNYTSLRKTPTNIITTSNVGLNEGAYLYWIAEFMPTLTYILPSDRILFTEESGDETAQLPFFSRRSFPTLIYMAESREFVCATRPGVLSTKLDLNDTDISLVSMFSYHDWSKLRMFSLTSHQLSHGYSTETFVNASFKKFADLGEWFDSVAAPTGPMFASDLVPVCYQGTFIVEASQILRQPKAVWSRMHESLMRGTSIEESHFVERVLAGLLSRNLSMADKATIQSTLANGSEIVRNGFKLHIQTFHGSLIGALFTPWRLATQPSLVIIGAQKSSSTALARIIGKSPHFGAAKDIAPFGYETHFFDDLGAFGFGTNLGPFNETLIERYQDEFFIRAKLSSSKKVNAFEKTPSYLFMGHKVAPLLHAITPWVRVMAILRDPSERAISQFRHDGFNVSNITVLAQCIKNDIALLNASRVLDLIKDVHGHCYLNSDETELLSLRWSDYINRMGFSWQKSSCQGIIGRGLYWPQLAFFEPLFPDKIMLIRTETLKSNASEVIRSVKKFLKVRLPWNVTNYYKGVEIQGVHAPDDSLLAKVQRIFEPFNRHLQKCMGNLFGATKKSIKNTPSKTLGALRLQKCASIDVMRSCSKEGKNCPSFATKRGNSTGVVVLGMHRSGTSALSGILSRVYDLDLLGDKMIEPDPSNPKGYFENFHLVYQNEQFMIDQNMPRYDALQSFDAATATVIANRNASQHFINGEILMRGFYIALSQRRAWLMKDPRLCFTLPVWLCLMDGSPGVVFIYRDPVEVSMSLHSKGEFSMEFGLWFWLENNMLAIKNSAHLCRVVVAHDNFYRNPVDEVERIGSELQRRCRISNVRSAMRSKEELQAVVTTFIQPNLRHHHQSNVDICSKKESTRHSNSHPDNIANFVDHNTSVLERTLTQASYILYCDIKTGSALSSEYDWKFAIDALAAYKNYTNGKSY